MLIIKTIDGVEKHLEGAHLSKSLLFKHLSLLKSHNPLDILVSSEILDQIIRFMEIDTNVLSAQYTPLDIKFKTCDFDFFSDCTNNTLVELCNASNYLNYPYLLELTCKILANRMQYRPTEELRELIGQGNEIIEDTDDDINKELEWLSSSE
ncbi:hypothetical protein NBO_386g0022 [Nosema bombycis CQ1]|uniref:SKP1 component dimerisation domain-containing protein n=1 Tax=Nosema bombycis (strain CQ1 / CVCC 102059) TaxID=578461 RepID=R0MEV3_NOSB1|nr:hypothetical protein NBO_386g0022 [Nosema bombycis CQ1]|eukprot:EOB12665.1 hypothetical protein NBO_386g0022 [Nosema bombycis CQ1]